MIELHAEMRLHGVARGGLGNPVKNGLRPSFSYAGELVACEVWAEGVGVDGLVPIESSVRARIRLPYADQLGWSFVGGERFELNIASQVIGEGSVMSVIGPGAA